MECRSYVPRRLLLLLPTPAELKITKESWYPNSWYHFYIIVALREGELPVEDTSTNLIGKWSFQQLQFDFFLSTSGLQVYPQNTNSSKLYTLDGPGPGQNRDHVKRTIFFVRKHKQFSSILLLGPCGNEALHQYAPTCFFISLEPGKASSFSNWPYNLTTLQPYNCEEEKAKGAESEAPCPEYFEEHLARQGQDARNNLYINCIGTDPNDRRALEDSLSYHPRNGGLDFRIFDKNARKSTRRCARFTCTDCIQCIDCIDCIDCGDCRMYGLQRLYGL